MSQIDVSKLNAYARLGSEGLTVSKLNMYARLRPDSGADFVPDFQSFTYAQKIVRP